MLTVLIIIAALLLWTVAVLYKVCGNQVAAQKRSEEFYRAILDKMPDNR